MKEIIQITFHKNTFRNYKKANKNLIFKKVLSLNNPITTNLKFQILMTLRIVSHHKNNKKTMMLIFRNPSRKSGRILFNKNCNK